MKEKKHSQVRTFFYLDKFTWRELDMLISIDDENANVCIQQEVTTRAASRMLCFPPQCSFVTWLHSLMSPYSGNAKKNHTHQYCHIFLAWNGRLHKANVSTTTISIRMTPLLARSTLLDECDTCVSWVPCRWWKLFCDRHVVTTTLSDSTETCNWIEQDGQKDTIVVTSSLQHRTIIAVDLPPSIFGTDSLQPIEQMPCRNGFGSSSVCFGLTWLSVTPTALFSYLVLLGFRLKLFE